MAGGRPHPRTPACLLAFPSGALAHDHLAHILRGRPLLALDQIKLDRVALGERLEPIPLNGAVVDEAVLVTAVRCDETKPLGVIEPLHLSSRTHVPLLKYIRYNTMLRGP